MDSEVTQDSLKADELDQFLLDINSQIHSLQGSGGNNIDRQLERHYLAVTGLISPEVIATRHHIDRISAALESRFNPALYRSRIPGVKFIHKVVGRLVSRHTAPLAEAIELGRQALDGVQLSTERLTIASTIGASEATPGEVLTLAEMVQRLNAEVELLRSKLSDRPTPPVRTS